MSSSVTKSLSPIWTANIRSPNSGTARKLPLRLVARYFVFALIEDGSVIIVDTARADVPTLDRKILVASHRDQGLKACWLRQVGASHILVPENPHYAPEEYSANKNWSLLGEVVWWITTHPKR